MSAAYSLPTPEPSPAPKPKGEPGGDDLNRGIIFTRISPRLARAMTGLFLAAIFTVPVVQVTVELARGQDVQALAVLRLHIEEYGESQFSEIIQESANSYLKAGFGDTAQRADHFQRTKDDPDSIPADNEGDMVAGEKHARAIKQSGFRDCNQAGQKTFYFYPNGWNVLFSRAGLDGGEAAKAVLAAGFLVTQAGGKLQIKKRTQPGRAQGAIRVYAVKGSILEGP